MGRYVWRIILLAHVLAVPCLSQNDMLSVVVDLDKNSISMEIGDPDICNGFPCPSGTKCVVQKSPALLMIPIPHCIPDKPSPAGMCKKVDVGANILQCKTQSEWTVVGKTQCKLTQLQDQPTKLVNTKAWHVCPLFTFPPATRYLSASFNCCREGYETTQSQSTSQTSATTTTSSSQEVRKSFTTLPPSTTQRPMGMQLVKDKISEVGLEAAEEFLGLDSTDSTEQSSSVFYLLLLVLGLSFLLSFLLISLLVSLRMKQGKRHQQQKVVMTSVVNPAAVTEYDSSSAIQHSNDKSSLVDNMQATY